MIKFCILLGTLFYHRSEAYLTERHYDALVASKVDSPKMVNLSKTQWPVNDLTILNQGEKGNDTHKGHDKRHQKHTIHHKHDKNHKHIEASTQLSFSTWMWASFFFLSTFFCVILPTAISCYFDLCCFLGFVGATKDTTKKVTGGKSRKSFKGKSRTASRAGSRSAFRPPSRPSSRGRSRSRR